jgi:hypothetical protein
VPKSIKNLAVFRMIHYKNLEYILENGINYRNSTNFDPNYVNIGSAEIITHRDDIPVKCYPETTVNEYVPFYFGVKTPMLYKIKTGNGVPIMPQSEIIYLVCSFDELTQSNLKWCFTNGNAAKYITKFYNQISDIKELDWKSIEATEWTDNNSDGDHDRMRKKHSEFLVKDHVPVNYIKAIVVLTKERQKEIEKIVAEFKLPIKVIIDKDYKYYYT